MDGFVFGRRDGIFEARIHANADRAIDLFLACFDHLPPALSLDIDDARSGDRWIGAELANDDVRDAIARAKLQLSTTAGMEITVFSEDEQISLTPNLQVIVYAKSDRWLYLLQGKGLKRAQSLQPRSWALARDEFPPSTDSMRALGAIVLRLRLVRTGGDVPR
jgi:hypothetical protein